MKVSKLLIVFISILTWDKCQCASNLLYNEERLSSFMADMWLEGADVLRILWRDCSKKIIDTKDVTDMKEYFPKFVKCMKKKTLRALDRSLSTDIVPVAEGVNLVRYELVDRQGKVMHSSENDTNFWSEHELETGDWRMLALERMSRVLRTHVIKLDFSGDDSPEKAEFRHRRRHQMMTMMMFGIMSMGVVLVPMGFQFLAVLGGKALLLAKMALILSSIQGLKKVDDWNHIELQKGKVATSPVNYGFYHSYPPAPYEHYEKRDLGSEPATDWPEPATIPATVPPPLAYSDPWQVDGRPGIKIDRMNPLAQQWKHELTKPVKPENGEPRVYPVYPAETSAEVAATSFFGTLDGPSPLSDLTTTPGEVQAEYTIDLPLNRIHFQSPTTLVPA